MSLSNLLPPVATFLRAVQTGDRAALCATLYEDAVMIDEAREYRGDAKLTWLEGRFLRRLTSFQPVNEAKLDGETVVTVVERLRGSDGENVQVLRNWCFTTKADRILAIRMEPNAMPALPETATAYVRATNNFDLDGLVDTFADDALVNDQLRDYRGKQAIRGWAEREVIGQRLTMYVIDAVEHYGGVIVNANVNGDFDGRGLPDPLVLTFYFSAASGRIVQLIILRNWSG